MTENGKCTVCVTVSMINILLLYHLTVNTSLHCYCDSWHDRYTVIVTEKMVNKLLLRQ